MEFDKQCYTARQLYSMPPALLHHATSRLLIGHAPTDWLVRSHRRWRETARAFVSGDKTLKVGAKWGSRAQRLMGQLTRDLELSKANAATPKVPIVFERPASRRSSQSSVSSLDTLGPLPGEGPGAESGQCHTRKTHKSHVSTSTHKISLHSASPSRRLTRLFSRSTRAASVKALDISDTESETGQEAGETGQEEQAEPFGGPLSAPASSGTAILPCDSHGSHASPQESPSFDETATIGTAGTLGTLGTLGTVGTAITGTAGTATHYWRRLLAKTPQGRRFLHRKRGDILFVRQFSVQVRIAHTEAKQFDRFEIPNSTVKERAKEYTAVARWTGKPWAPVAIYLYASQQVSKHLDQRWSRARKHKILLTSKTKASFFDTLDMSVALWEPSKHENTHFFLFTSQSVNAQVSWLFFLLNACGAPLPEVLQMKIPQVDTTLQVPRLLLRKAAHSRADLPSVTYSELCSPFAHPSQFVSELFQFGNKVVDDIQSEEPGPGRAKAKERAQDTTPARPAPPPPSGAAPAPAPASVPDPNAPTVAALPSPHPRKYFLGWRRVDFVRTILWEDDVHAISANALLDHHSLELRQVHTLTTPQEPPAIEGFCWRLTTWRGEGRRQRLVTRTYLHSHNHLLFHINPNKVLMPNFTVEGCEHNHSELERDDVDAKVRAYLEGLPLVSDITPYPIDADGHITWVRTAKTNEDLTIGDARAVYEHSRLTANIEASEGCLDMSTITSVRAVSNPQMLELVLEGDQRLLIRTPERESRDAWVLQLKKLAVYWRAQRQQQLREAKRVYEQNMMQNTNFILRTKLESTFTVPDMASFPIETTVHTRPIIHSGYLYKKAHKHSFFYKYYAVLTNCSLVLYHPEGADFSISRDVEHVDTHHVKDSAYDLLHTYVYTGSTAREYLVRENEDSFNFAQMYDGVPRIYNNDWIIQDREDDCCFVLWSEKRAKLKASARHGVFAGRLVCMARSRVERDQWVNAFQSVTTRLSALRTGNNVEVAGGTILNL